MFTSPDSRGYNPWHNTTFKNSDFVSIDTALGDGKINHATVEQFGNKLKNGAKIAVTDEVPINIGGDGSNAPNVKDGIDNFTHIFLKFAGAFCAIM